MAGETILTIVGNLTADPELRQTRSGRSVANFTIAATPRQFNRQSNQWEDGQALFLRCDAWGDLADHCAQSLSKGMRVIAQGRLSQRSYQAKDGSNRTVVEMTVDEIGPSLRYATAQVARQRQSNGFNGGQSYGAQQPAQPQSQTAPQQPAQQQVGGDPWADSADGWSTADFGGGDPDDPSF